MILNIGILVTLNLMAAIYGFYYDQHRVFLVDGDMKFQDHSVNDDDAKIYYDAIKDTFDLYYRDKRYKNGRVCRSDQTHLDIADKDTIYSKLKKNFNNSCSYVIGNVVIAHISDQDISFLDSIKEISGYLFIFKNTAGAISLKNLDVIRGENALLLKGEKFALVVAGNYFGSKQLEYLLLPNLQVILRHDVMIFESPGLCYMNMINWDSLIEEPQKVFISEKNDQSCLVNFNTSGRRFCHPDCPRWGDKQFCWSNSSLNCQKINECRNRTCPYVSKCYINPTYKTEECCHDQCAGGCGGTSNKQCLTCKNFNNDGFCVEYCPSQIIHKNFKHIKNPDGKLAFHHLCVEKCPVKFFNEYGNCVLNCTTPNTYPVNETCVECPNGVCPKVCLMKDVIVNKEVTFLNRPMLDRLENCTVYDGNIIINMLSFTGDPWHNMTKEQHGIRPKDLKKLEKLQEIYGYVEVNTGKEGYLRSLIFLKNLRIIRANNIVSNKKYGLSITSNYKLLFLALKSLTEVQNGDIVIANNPNLCFTKTLNSQSLKHSKQLIITKNRKNCRPCDDQCDRLLGCWGPTNGLCVKCSYYVANNGSCVPNCSLTKGFFYGNLSLSYKNERQCSSCHLQCNRSQNTCSGPGDNQCNHGCKRLSYIDSCVEQCPSNHFANITECKPCHSSCTNNSGNFTLSTCSGPGEFIGDGGCQRCNHVILNGDMSNTTGNSLTCVKASYSCPSGFFKFVADFRTLGNSQGLPDYISKNKIAIKMLRNWVHNATDYKIGYGSLCLPCHPQCSACSDGSNWYCLSCRHYKLGDKCVENCPIEHFTVQASPSKDIQCIRCHEECDGRCNGSSEFDCLKCRHVKIHTNGTDNQFFCNQTCGELYQVVINSEILCVEKWRADQLSSSWIQIGIIALAVSVVTICGFTVLIYFVVGLHKKSQYDRKQIKMDEFYHPQTEALVGIQPNMATLLLITESQLTRGDIIGSGAFGVVYKAIWQPNLDKIDKSTSFLKRNLARYSKESSIKLLVAVKVLTDISDPTNNMQLLEEAKVMASVDHTCCLRILGLCLTAHPQLITQFMPLGCLLEFCQKHRTILNNTTLLIWAKQIAQGMEYLESKGIIHCDLAARNVLVQSPKQVKITDFGLAKILDQSQHQYQSKGGRMPIKWLAIECIKHRVFSFKSDVWSYGVTLWEMFTFGEKPFQNIKAFEILNHLEKGQRLSQPKICSIDIYAIMVQCWLVDSESRPTFAELTKAFELMANNPNRYLLIQNSPEMESIYYRLDDDALQYDEFLQALVGVPQLNPDYESADQSIDEQSNIRSVKNRYREMCSFKNSFVNYVNEWRDNCNPANNNEYMSTNVTTEETYEQSLSMWSAYFQDNKRLSNSTLVTNVNTPTDYTSIQRMLNNDLSDDGYLIPKANIVQPTLNQPSNSITESESDVFFSCRASVEKEIFVGHESSL